MNFIPPLQITLYEQLKVFWGAQNILFVDMNGDYMAVHFMQNSLGCIFMSFAIFIFHNKKGLNGVKNIIDTQRG